MHAMTTLKKKKILTLKNRSKRVLGLYRILNGKKLSKNKTLKISIV